ncbi:MAG: sigma-70 family RNA polymerase sigma factor [Burkholderiales bacterium]|nr:sigma-70 family RNA polymerase sigma factor [Burkholderiales bacterium]
MEEGPGDADAMLLQAYLGGDAAAFERLYDRHGRACHDFIRRMLAHADEATIEDLHQEVWVAVARAAARFDAAKARFTTWAFTIARNKVMDHHRRQPGVVHLVDDAGLAEVAADPEQSQGWSPERIVENRQLAAAILAEVQALPYAQRETFVLFAHHELSLDEVAQVTGVGVETAKSRLRYARNLLRQRLAAWSHRHG